MYVDRTCKYRSKIATSCGFASLGITALLILRGKIRVSLTKGQLRRALVEWQIILHAQAQTANQFFEPHRHLSGFARVRGEEQDFTQLTKLPTL